MSEEKPKHVGGRPKRVFSDEQEEQISQMALDNCHLDTIALALCIPLETLRRRFGAFISEKRAFGRTELRRAQREKALIGKDTGMLCFLGKNELGQADRKEIELDAGQSLKSFIDWLVGRNGDTKDKS